MADNFPLSFCCDKPLGTTQSGVNRCYESSGEACYRYEYLTIELRLSY